MSEINLSEQEIVSLDEATEEKKVDPEVVELEWSEIQNIAIGQSRIDSLETQLATMLLNTEKTKVQVLREIEGIKSTIYQNAAQLKDSKGIDPELSYELKLPVDIGEPGYFIKNNAE